MSLKNTKKFIKHQLNSQITFGTGYSTLLCLLPNSKYVRHQRKRKKEEEKNSICISTFGRFGEVTGFLVFSLYRAII